jgi:hypothetical protein
MTTDQAGGTPRRLAEPELLRLAKTEIAEGPRIFVALEPAAT